MSTQDKSKYKQEYRVITYMEESQFKRMVEMHLNDGTGWYLVGGISIAIQFTSVRYAQALARTLLL